MKPLLASLALPILLAACASHADRPRVELSDVGFVLHLPAPMQHALDSLAPGFRSIRTGKFRADVAQAAAAEAGSMQPLFATIGDLDGDGSPDAVEEGTLPGDSTLHVIAIFDGAHPHAVEVADVASYDADVVGFYLAPPPAGTKDAFRLVEYPDSSMLYTYRNGDFQGTRIGN